MSFLQAFLSLLVCIGLAYIFLRGFLGCAYDIANWAVKILNKEEDF